ncbi:MAG: M20/M25/M40 family metallo-hydrolase [Bacteroidota bacterium]
MHLNQFLPSKSFSFLILIGFLLSGRPVQAQNQDSTRIRGLFDEILRNGRCYGWLDYLANTIGGRLSGSPEAARAVEYVYIQMKQLGVDSVWKQEVMVPHWVRGGKESASILSQGKKTDVRICALGGSVPTPAEGLSAGVVEVHDWDELEKLGRERVAGRIVFMNHPMKSEFINTFDAYGEAGRYRWGTAMRAGKLGAVGVIVRSMTLAMDDYPHTGAMGYDDSIPKIPACAISTRGAETLSKSLKMDPDLQVNFKQTCSTLPDALSHNVIAEIRGSEYPDEVVVVGGHLDAWDTGDGAHDDGAGIVQSMEVLRTIKALGIRPKRTIRFVAFMNEENGGRGGKRYAEWVKSSGQRPLAAIESDAGGFTPRGFSFKGDSARVAGALTMRDLFQPYLMNAWKPGYGGADINHLEDQGTLLIGLNPDSQRYFNHHHAETDTFDQVNKRELELGAAGMCALSWLLAEYGLR